MTTKVKKSSERATGISDETFVVTVGDTAKSLAGRRITFDTTDTFYGPFKILTSPPDIEDSWRLLDLDSVTLSRISPWQLLEYLADLSPAISRALWDFLRFANPGWEVKAFRSGTNTSYPTAQKALNDFFNVLVAQYGSVDVVINRLNLGAFLRGAFFAELVLDPTGRKPIDIATPDPHTVRFRRVPDPVRLFRWELGQIQFGRMANTQPGDFVNIERPTVKYIPIDPFPGNPYGRIPAAPALFPTLFLLGLMHDLRRVISQQGYPRLDVSINLETLANSIPEDIGNDPDKFKVWAEAIINQVEAAYKRLQPDDVYIHTSVVEVNRPVGAVDARSLGAVDGIIKGLERMAGQALKTMPLLMGSAEGMSEANANRQWEVHAAGIRTLQHLSETMLEWLLALALQAQGISADVQFRFSELRAAEAFRDEQTKQLKIGNALAGYLNGWISQEQASQYAFNQQPIEPEPLIMPTAQSFAKRPDEEVATKVVPDAGGAQPQSGDNTVPVNPEENPDDQQEQNDNKTGVKAASRVPPRNKRPAKFGQRFTRRLEVHPTLRPNWSRDEFLDEQEEVYGTTEVS